VCESAECTAVPVTTHATTVAVTLEPSIARNCLGSYNRTDRQYHHRTYNRICKLLGVTPTHDAAASDDGTNSFCKSFSSPS
jgi:hypothetical protein